MSQRAADLREHREERSFDPDTVAVVHDLRAPLGVITGYADLLARGDLGALPEAAHRAIAALAGKASEMRALLDSLLDAGRPEAPLAAARDRRSVDLRSLAEDAVDRATHRARLAGHRISAQLDGPVPVRTDPRLVGRILDNLINNAFAHGRRPGHVVVSAQRNGAYGEISVRDDGPGLPPALRDMLCSADEAPSRTPSGSLGLVICRTLADRIGATLRYEHAPDGGATIVVEFPLAI